MAKFFIDRPVFAWVIAIFIMLGGALAIFKLPVARFPKLVPPTVSLNVTLSGSSASTVQDTVTQIIEQNMNGLDGLLYMTSLSSSSGRMLMRLTFDSDIDVNMAQVQVQNKLQTASRSLSEEVTRQGIVVNKVSDGFLQRYAFISRDGSMSQTDLADFVASVLQDPMSRIPGVGQLTLYGSPYAMRIWLDPHRLAARGLTAADVIRAVESQNEQLSTGQIGDRPDPEGAELNVTLISREKLNTPVQFENIVIRAERDGSSVRIRDVARTEMGQQAYLLETRYNGAPAVGLGIQLAEGANALETADRVAAFIEKMRPVFPEGVDCIIPYDTVPFVRLSIQSVVRTLFEAVGLVFLIMLLFLQNFRATLIPTLAVPVVLLGTFGVMAAFGFTINTLTMFGLVLAIGLLVDDAIVVVENVERIMREEGLSPREATRKSMEQISGALLGISLVLAAVFVPMAFFGGMTGVIYRQFSLTIVAAMGLSVLTALILTPALCASILRNTPERSGGFFGLFNRGFDALLSGYAACVRKIVRRTGRMMILFVLLTAVMAVLFRAMPTSFLPIEDQGLIFANILMPSGTSSKEVSVAAAKVERYFLEDEKESVQGVMTTLGAGSGSSRGQNTAMVIVRLKDWSLRTAEHLRCEAIARRARAAFSSVHEAQVRVFMPPEVLGLGESAGFAFELQDLVGHGHEALLRARDELIRQANESPLLMNVRSSAPGDTLQLNVRIDDLKAGMNGLDPQAINTNLAAIWGGKYVNDFVDRGRVKRVYVQADSPFRRNPEDLRLWQFRNELGEMVPFEAFAETSWGYGPTQLDRYNGVPACLIEGTAARGVSSGMAMDEMERLFAGLPEGFGYEWTGISYQEKLSGSQSGILYILSILVVFLSLAALYESWTIPFAVILVVPLGVLGAVGLSMALGLSNGIYFKVGLLAVIGLAAKNAILIVEFARSLHEGGSGLRRAVTEAARLRLRPILMTSLAFLIGVLPLAAASGAGAASRQAIGIGVFGGTVAATVLGIFFVPVFFCAVTRFFDFLRGRRADRRNG
ncbi:MAG: efflux RND transporter permease subunit [Desulfovibrionaceae bacterium]|nr:efflux RND transporter permease subunit [Desulfovibrionaceae bacterium]